MPVTETAPVSPRERGEDEPLTVLIADDHPLFRRGLARAIRRAPGLELVAEATDGREALALIGALDPDVAVLDHRMPELSGVDVCAQLRLRPERGRTNVLLLSAFEDREMVAAAVAGGAAGYVGKGASQGEICEAIERVGRGELAFLAADGPGDRPTV
jgi:two-component system nitrate/nitrite response regulator NarL